MTDKLEPCPFCGGAASSWIVNSGSGHGESYDAVCCGCQACGVRAAHEDYSGRETDKRRAAVIAAWNHRAVPSLSTSPDTRSEEIRELIEAAIVRGDRCGQGYGGQARYVVRALLDAGLLDVGTATPPDSLITLRQLSDQLFRAQEELAALRAAIKPFATEAKEWPPTLADDTRPVLGISGGRTDFAAFTVGDLRRAAAPQPPAQAGMTVDEAWLDLTEKTDRTSPAEYPDMALIARDELGAYMLAAAPQPPAQAVENGEDDPPVRLPGLSALFEGDAAPQPPAQTVAVRVRPLSFKELNKWQTLASTKFGSYLITHGCSGGATHLFVPGSDKPMEFSAPDPLSGNITDQAISAANAHYRGTIMSAIEVVPQAEPRIMHHMDPVECPAAAMAEILEEHGKEAPRFGAHRWVHQIGLLLRHIAFLTGTSRPESAAKAEALREVADKLGNGPYSIARLPILNEADRIEKEGR